MNKKFFSVVAAAALMAMPIYAKNATKDYQRPSLHMVLLTTSTDAAQGTAQITDSTILGYVADSWNSYEFPVLYNDFRTATKSISVDKAKGGIMDLLAMYNSPESLNGMTIDQLKNIIEMMKGKEYLASLQEEIDKQKDQISHELVKKWWSIQDDGTCSDTLLLRLSCYAATQNQAKDAAQTTLGAGNAILNELANVVMSSTYVTFTKVEFYENEPIAAFTRNIMQVIADQTPAPANAAATLAANKTYDAMKEGYTAFTNALLYQLEWNDSIANEFYGIWSDGTHVDMEKFNAMKFNLKYCGATKASATCMMKKEDKGKDAQAMVEKTIYKALDREFVDLQDAYEEFRPMVPIIGFDVKGNIIADMGTKEGVKVKDKFNILEGYADENGVLKYRTKGTVAVIKWDGEQFENGVWDNQSQDNIDSAAAADGTEMEVVGTHLKKFKAAEIGMFVKKTK